MKRCFTRVLLVAAFLTSTGALAEAQPPAIKQMFAACERESSALSQIIGNPEFAANFNAACGMGLDDGYHHNAKSRAEFVTQLDDARKSDRDYERMAVEIMNARYLRSYDAAEAEAKKAGK